MATHAFPDDDGLAEVEPGDFVGDVQAVFDILKFDISRFSFCQNAVRSELVLNKICRIDQLDALFRHSSATPPIRASVFRRGRFHSILTIRRSGIAPENI